MRLFTCQSREVLDIAKEREYFADFNRSEYRDWDFLPAYEFMMREMDRRFKRPPGATTPVWANYKVRGRVGRSDLRWLEFRRYSKGSVYLELEVPDHEVLLSDEETWHYVLNNLLFAESLDEAEAKLEQARCDALPEREKQQTLEQSWQKIFLVEPNQYSSAENIQACFWSIKPEYIKKVWEFGWPQQESKTLAGQEPAAA